METIKMLVLETDSPHPNTLEEIGSFGEVFNRVFKAAGSKHVPPMGIDVDMHYVVNDPAQGKNGHVPKAKDIPEDVGAVLITGSLYDAHGNDDWIQKLRALVVDLWKSRPDMKFTGICFGHQLLSRVLGGKVEPTPGNRWELAHITMDLTPVGQKLFVTEDKKMSLHQMHQDQVTQVPSPETTDLIAPGTKVHVWASSEHTSVQGLYIRDRIFTSQGHLEIGEDMVHRQTELRIQAGSITDEHQDALDHAQNTAHLEHDGEKLAAAMLRFFHGDDHDVD